VGDEVGTDINQKDDGRVGGQKNLSQKGTRANIKISHNDGRFTAIDLTASSGEPVMAIFDCCGRRIDLCSKDGS